MLTVMHTESSTGWGGQEHRILEESKGMAGRGYRLLIAAPAQSNLFARAEKSGIETFAIDFRKNNLAAIFSLASLMKREKVDIVNTHSSLDSWFSTLAAQITKLKPKVIRTRHLSTPVSTSPFSSLVYNVLTDAIMTTGEEIRRQMISHNGFDGSKITSVPTGINLERFNPAVTRPAFRPAGFSIGMVGVLRSWKGHSYLIEAAPEILKRIPDACFYIVGNGPQYDNIKNLISDLSLQDRVVMLGHREDVPEIIAAMDVIVHPSYANEGVPQSILQAMAMGKPVVASDAGAIKEVVLDGKTGFLIEPGNPGAIAQKITALYENPGLMAEFGKEGRDIVEKEHTISTMLDKIESIYKVILH